MIREYTVYKREGLGAGVVDTSVGRFTSLVQALRVAAARACVPIEEAQEMDGDDPREWVSFKGWGGFFYVGGEL